MEKTCPPLLTDDEEGEDDRAKLLRQVDQLRCQLGTVLVLAGNFACRRDALQVSVYDLEDQRDAALAEVAEKHERIVSLRDCLSSAHIRCDALMAALEDLIRIDDVRPVLPGSTVIVKLRNAYATAKGGKA